MVILAIKERKVHFLYPADVLKPRQPDEMYAEEATAIRAAGFGVAVVPLESLRSGQAKIAPDTVFGQRVIYRGWMLSLADYQALCQLVVAYGGQPLTSPELYRLAHHLPRWYPHLRELTPQTAIFSAKEDLEAGLRALGWGRYFIKDYVKSLKASVGSIIERPEDVATVVAEMKKYRGMIEGGVCVRRVEQFRPEMERRFFIIGGRPHAPEPSAAIPHAVQVCASRIHSPFFSVDIVQRTDGIERVVEIGDGQVSDIVGWKPERFAQVWRERADEPLAPMR